MVVATYATSVLKWKSGGTLWLWGKEIKLNLKKITSWSHFTLVLDDDYLEFLTMLPFLVTSRNRLHWKKQHPVRQKSHKYAPTLTTETSTVTWLALQLQKMLHIHLRPTGLMAVVSVEAGLQKWNTLLCVILFGHCVGCFLSQCRWPTRGTLAP